MSRIKSKEGARVHRAGYQPNLSRIRIRILKYLNTKYSNTQTLLKEVKNSEQDWTSTKAQMLSRAVPSKTCPVLLRNIKLAGNPAQSLLLAEL